MTVNCNPDNIFFNKVKSCIYIIASIQSVIICVFHQIKIMIKFHKIYSVVNKYSCFDYLVFGQRLKAVNIGLYIIILKLCCFAKIKRMMRMPVLEKFAGMHPFCIIFLADFNHFPDARFEIASFIYYTSPRSPNSCIFE